MSGRAFSRTRGLALSATFTALISVVAPISIPITPAVPLTLQVFVVYLAMMIAGPIYGTLALLIYLLLGAIGVPVYAGASSGSPVLLGPTGGYLFAFPLAALVGGLVSARRASSRRRDVLMLAISEAIAIGVIYGIGVSWLAYSLHLDAGTAVLFGAIPFIPFDAIKAAVALPIAVRLRWSHLQLPVSAGKVQPVAVPAR